MPVHQVTLLPSGRLIPAASTQSLLNAGLESGLNLRYGCEGGSCGLCLARLKSGQIRNIQHSDYVLSVQQKSANYFLSCCHSANSDCEVEMPELGSADEIPLQQIETRVFKLQLLTPQVLSIMLKTPRSQALNFLAGQKVRVQWSDSLVRDKALASCPCDGRKLEIHVRKRLNDNFSEYAFNRLHTNDRVWIQGPSGDFVLDDETERSLVLIAFDTGFAGIKSLLEHAVALDKEQPIRLYWIVTPEQQPYLENYCRSLEDALDNLSYMPIAIRQNSEHCIKEVFSKILAQEKPLTGSELYVTLPEQYASIAQQMFDACDMPRQYSHIDAQPLL